MTFKSSIKISLRTEIFPMSILALAFVSGVYFYRHFPEQVIIHWDFNNQANGYSGKFFGAFGIPLILLGIYLLFLLLPCIDPRKERYKEFQKIYHIIKNTFLIVLFAAFLATGFANLGHQVPFNHLVPILVGILIMIIGNFMGKIKKNWFMGIRTPWTLSSENVWNKTHRVGGWLFTILGFIMIISSFLSQILSIIVVLCGILFVVIFTIIYSYILYKKEQLKP